MVLYIEKLDKEWPMVVNFINAGGGDPLCLYDVHYIEQKDCTLSLRLGKRQGVYERLLITNFTR